MAKSKGKIELQVEIKTQDQLDELLSKEGLIVVDAYSAWCGPCKAIVSSLKRLKNELGDDFLIFATAETDSIDLLEAYRMKSQPTFLFYAGGILVNVVRGCNCPLLIKTIRNELEQEHKVMDGKANRLPFVDQDAVKESDIQERKEEDTDIKAEEEEIVELPKQVTVAIIKPDAVKAGLVDEIIQKVEESGFEVLRKEEKILSKEEASEFYKQHEGSEHFDQLVEFMSSGPCMTLVLSKAEQSLDAGDDGTIDYFRDLIGPKDVNIAKEKAPNSIRALYGTDTVMNAIHGCDSSESAARELAFFYPDFVAPKVMKKRKKRQLQRTLALIRPDALRTQKESILAKIQEAGFSIAMSKEITLTREQAEGFYSDYKDSDFFETLVTCMTSGPMMALCLAREDAVIGWRELLGPKDVTVANEQAPESLRSQFGVDESLVNPLHGSDSIENAEKEIQHFFPMESTVAVIKPEVEPDKREEIIQRIKEAGFKIQFEKELTLDKKLASQLYHEHEGKDFFEGLTDYMSSGPTLFMVLAREDAVSGWRAFMGPTDPQEALQTAPYSLRAQFGLDMMKNAVHGSSNVEKAEEVIKELFPEVDILPDGSVKEKEATTNEAVLPDQVSNKDPSEEARDKETDRQDKQQDHKETDNEVKPDEQVISEKSSEADKKQEIKTENEESGKKLEFQEEAEENLHEGSSERESSENEPKGQESLADNKEDGKSGNDVVDTSKSVEVEGEETKTNNENEGGEETQTTEMTKTSETKLSEESGTENNKTSDEGEVGEAQTNEKGRAEKTSGENEVLETQTADEEGHEETGRSEEGGGEVNSNS